MISELDKEEIKHLSVLLKGKPIKISRKDLEDKINKISKSQQIFPLLHQRALLIRLLVNYERTKKKEVIILDEIDQTSMPRTITVGVLAEDWPGMSNSILGIVHHKERNVLFVRGFTVEYEKKIIGIVILAFNLNNHEEYQQFLGEKKELINKIKEASIGTRSKYVLLEDETVKFEIYNDLVNRLNRTYTGPDSESLTGESGEAIKFISSRSREYLEERNVSDLSELIMDNVRFQQMIRSRTRDEVIKIKNFETKYEKLTGITFVGREELISIEDFLKTLNFIVPAHIIKHHKSFVTHDGILVYRIEIVDQYGKPLNNDMIKTIEKSLNKLVVISCRKNFSQIKTIGGYEHYARAIIPFLMMELKKTNLSQVFIKVDEKTDFYIDIKLIVVSYKTRRKKVYPLISLLEKTPGIEINSSIPPRFYGGSVRIDIFKLNISLSEFSSIKEIFSRLKDILSKEYGKIRDFDQGFREIDMRVLNDLLEKLSSTKVSLIRDIFFNFDELFRIEIPFNVLVEVIILCSKAIEESNRDSGKRVIIRHKNLLDSNRTLFVISYIKEKKMLGKIIKKIKDFDICFTKLEWNQRTYFILVIHKDNNVLAEDEILEFKTHTLNLIK
ncbi:MAG: hypothetical protein KAT17_04910 [Candidatus Aminicenantes bacterium]|nr:hypothetical protein [Candidatus Aminicenantes bacterium]